MPGDHVGTARDHHLVDIAADQNLAMTVGRRHRVVGAAVAHQGQRAHSTCPLLPGVMRDRDQVVPPDQPDQSVDLAPGAALTGPAEPVGEQVVQLQFAKRHQRRLPATGRCAHSRSIEDQPPASRAAGSRIAESNSQLKALTSVEIIAERP